ncbi:MAG: acetate--CoA ligase family protein, partial [Desulfobulbaceae bacterium]|nr:acetate--CoA ligase family protein [Desulfobulbaceae bacterium]
MPKLLEYQGKRLLKDSGIPVPAGDVASTPEEAYEIAERLQKGVVIKAQVGVTGRFQAGGIKFVDNADEAKKAASELLGKEIKGLTVEKILVEEKLSVTDELYASVIVDDSCKVKGPVLMFSTKGGTGIEEIAADFP